MSRWIRLAFCVLGAGLVSATAAAGEHTFVITQLTNDALNNSSPQVSGKNVVWWSQTGSKSQTSEIWLYDGKAKTQLTNNAYFDQSPQVSGNNVTWLAQPDGTAATQYEIMYYDGITTTRLTIDAVQDFPPDLSGSTAVWEHGTGSAQEIYRSNGLPLTSDGIIDAAPDVHGSRVVWVNGSVPSAKILLYNGTTTVTAATSNLAINTPKVSDSLVVWRGLKNTNSGASGSEIYRYDGTNPTKATNLSNNEFTDFDPQVSGNHVVWWGGVFGDRQVYLNDGTTTTAISTGTLNQKPQIDGNLVVWQGNDGDDEIVVWDGTSAVQITSNTYADTNPRVSGNHIVWESVVPSKVDGTDIEIMSALRVLYGDSNFDGIVDGADYTDWADNFLQSNTVFAQGDFNQDGTVDGADYVLWADNFLQSDGPPPALVATSAVPEPTSAILGLIGVGVCAVALRSGRRNILERSRCR